MQLVQLCVDAVLGVYMCFSVFVFACLFVSVLELTRVDTYMYTEITYVL